MGKGPLLAMAVCTRLIVRVSKTWRRIGMILLGTALTTVSIQGQASETDFPEAKIKAAYLYNFLRFVEWPENMQEGPHICVIGYKQEYHSALMALEGQKVDDQKLKIKEYPRVNGLQDIEHCHLIFITSQAEENQYKIVEQIKGAPVLTVGESGEFTLEGGMIKFVTVDDKIRFEINMNAVSEADLRITSKILRIASKVIE